MAEARRQAATQGSDQVDFVIIGSVDASGFRAFTMETQKSKAGKKGNPEMATTVRRFAVKAGKYKQLDVKTTTGACHHCATWSCTAP